MSSSNVQGTLTAEEIVIDRSSWVDQDYRTCGATVSIPAAEARQFGPAIGWKVLDTRLQPIGPRADDTTHFADTTLLSADRF